MRDFRITFVVGYLILDAILVYVVKDYLRSMTDNKSVRCLGRLNILTTSKRCYIFFPIKKIEYYIALLGLYYSLAVLKSSKTCCLDK